MKKNRLLISALLLAILMFSVAGSYGVKPIKLEQSTPLKIDGNLSDWAGLPQYYITDPKNDSHNGAQSEIFSLRITVNSTHIFFGYTGNSSGATLLYIDTDPGEGTGLTHQYDAAGYGKRYLNFGNGFGAEWFLGCWDMTYYDLFNGSNNGAYVDKTTIDGLALKVNKTTGTFEAAVPFNLLFGSDDVSGKQIGVALVTAGGDDSAVYDILPNEPLFQTVSTSDYYTLTNYLVINLDSDGDGVANIQPQPAPGWVGAINSNTGENASAGMPLFITLEVYWHDDSNTPVHDHPNTTEAVVANVTITDKDNATVETYLTTMTHTPFEYAGNNDLYRMLIPGNKLVENYTVYLIFEVAVYSTKLTKSYIVCPAPVTNVTWVGGVVPSGGFYPPTEDLVIEAQAHWIANQTGTTLHDDPTGTLNVDMYLYYKVNQSSYWNKTKMDFITAFSDNDKYEANLGKFNEGTNITYYVNATADAGWMTTSNFTVMIGYEPPFNPVFNQTDPEGDEYGTYPTNAVFAPYHGFFDILYFEVAANAYHVRFSIQFYNISFNGWGGPNGFSHEIISIYIDNAAGGATDTIKNEFVNIEQDHAWDYAVFADGWIHQLYSSNDLSNPMDESSVVVSANPANGFINITVPVNMIGTPSSDWAYVVMAGSGDFNHYRAHNAEAGEWNFGGGDDSEIDPNVVDMLVPRGGNETATQFFLLNNYDVATQRRATVYAVGEGITFQEDTTAPTVTILSPQANQKFNVTDGSVTIPVSLDLSDPQQGTLAGLSKVQIFDGTILVTELTVNGLSKHVELNITLNDITESGNHTIKVLVFDVTGNSGNAEVVVELNVPTSSSTSSQTTNTPSETGGGFLPAPWVSILMTLVAIPVIIKKIRK